MKSIATILGAAVFALMMSGPAMAQYVPWAGSLPNQSAFNHWAKNHQKAAAELQANPGLMYNPNWRKKHPHFQHFIENHPEDWKALKQGGTRYYNQGFNSYLQQHPSWGNQVRQNPELMYDPAWRAKHPEFSNYMNQHPNVWGSTPYNPNAASPYNPNVQSQHHGKHWEHEQWMEHHRQEKEQRRQQHWQKWHQKHGDHDND